MRPLGNNRHVRQWVERELQALLHQQDVDVVVAFVMGLLTSPSPQPPPLSAPQPPAGSHPPCSDAAPSTLFRPSTHVRHASFPSAPHSTHPPASAPAAMPDISSASMTDAIQAGHASAAADATPAERLRLFLFERAPHFWHELQRFYRSQLTVQAYDLAVRYQAGPAGSHSTTTAAATIPPAGSSPGSSPDAHRGDSARRRGWDVPPGSLTGAGARSPDQDPLACRAGAATALQQQQQQQQRLHSVLQRWAAPLAAFRDAGGSEEGGQQGQQHEQQQGQQQGHQEGQQQEPLPQPIASPASGHAAQPSPSAPTPPRSSTVAHAARSSPSLPDTSCPSRHCQERPDSRAWSTDRPEAQGLRSRLQGRGRCPLRLLPHGTQEARSQAAGGVGSSSLSRGLQEEASRSRSRGRGRSRSRTQDLLRRSRSRSSFRRASLHNRSRSSSRRRGVRWPSHTAAADSPSRASTSHRSASRGSAASTDLNRVTDIGPGPQPARVGAERLHAAWEELRDGVHTTAARQQADAWPHEVWTSGVQPHQSSTPGRRRRVPDANPAMLDDDDDRWQLDGW
ncbi:hypothetical protein V8C86DRAFT_1401600 [Haematococcus lacustris]